ncbi:hypothetical protein TrispH2_011071 [Trichoplax sp. H2]|nr:hypothetical protein TrispH2_011071 [Trichoplax sp. H2]|eukprot:RDD36869.1 hypothetical protein TrispH2_011071 [Trichoplax sp. H2]
MKAEEECDNGWTKISNRCFKPSEGSNTFDNARRACQGFPGGDLAVDDSYATHNGLYFILHVNVRYWIGLKDLVGDNVVSDYHWLATNQSVTTGPQFWMSLYPTNKFYRCVHLADILLLFIWRDGSCNDFYRYVCQKPIGEVSSSVANSITSTSSTVSTIQLNSSLTSSTLSSNVIASTLAIANLSEQLASISSRLDVSTTELNSPIASSTLSDNTILSATTSTSQLELTTWTNSQIDVATSDLNLSLPSTTILSNSNSPVSTITEELELLTPTASNIHSCSSGLYENLLISSASSSVFSVNNNLNIILTTNTVLNSEKNFTVPNYYLALSSSLSVNDLASSITATMTASGLQLLVSSGSSINSSIYEDSPLILTISSSVSAMDNQIISSIASNVFNVITVTTSSGPLFPVSTISNFNRKSNAFKYSLSSFILSPTMVDIVNTDPTTTTIKRDEESLDTHNWSVQTSLWTDSNSDIILIKATSVIDESSAAVYQHLSSNSILHDCSHSIVANIVTIIKSILLTPTLSDSDLSSYTPENLLSSRTVTASITSNQPPLSNNGSYFAYPTKINKMINRIQTICNQLIANFINGVDTNPGFIFEQIDKLDADLAREIHQANITMRLIISTPESELAIQTISASDTKSIVNLAFSLSNKSVAKVMIPKAAFRFLGQDDTVTLVVRSYNIRNNWTENNISENNDSVIISSVLSCSVYPYKDKNFALPVHLYLNLHHQQRNPPYRCAYWEKTRWSEYGMKLKDYNSTTIHCITVHFTSFAILMQNSKALTEFHDTNLRIITYIGYSISLFALLIMMALIISSRVGIKAVASLIFLFGISWLFGILYYATSETVFAYLFTILNCPQGLLIFYFHCFRDHNMQDYIRTRFHFVNSIFPTRSMGEASRDTRDENTRYRRVIKIPLLPVSSENGSQDCEVIPQDPISLNKITGTYLSKRISVATLASTCDHGPYRLTENTIPVDP